MRQLSKSKIIAYRQCPKRLWLELHQPELRDDSGSEVVFTIGNQVGDIARTIYDPESHGLLIDVGELGWDEAFDRTSNWLATGDAPVFEAALRVPGALALADVILPVDEGDSRRWRMIEVKSSGSVKDYQRDDLAVQAHVAVQAGLELSSASIAHIDTSFVYPGDGDYQGLLHEVDLTEETTARSGEVAGWICGAQATAAEATEPEVETGPHCDTPFGCPFRQHCDEGKDLPPDPLRFFYRLHPTRRARLEESGITELSDLPDDELTEINRMIKRQTLAGRPRFDAAGAAKALARHPGTARFLDFETVAFAVPVWKGTRPYLPIPFQFSLHVLPENGELVHHEFLDLSANDPTRDFARALIDGCGSEGPVFAYNATFERRIMREAGLRHPDLAPRLEAICGRLVDLEPIARRHYYHPDQFGSWSLKAVLPAICPDLSYGDLDGVADGGMAQAAYLEAIDPATAPVRKREIERQLLDYCRLDTFALVRIWRFFRGLPPQL